MATDRSPRPKHDPRDKDVSDQLPEEQQEGAATGAGPRTGTRDAGNADAGDAAPEQDANRDAGNADAAGAAPEQDPGKSTGNPRAAG